MVSILLMWSFIISNIIMGWEDIVISNSKKISKKWLLLFFLFLLLWVAIAIFFYIRQNSDKWIIEKYVPRESDIYFRIRFKDWNKDMFQKFTQNMTAKNMKDCTDLMKMADEIAISTFMKKQLSIIYVKIDNGNKPLQKCVSSMKTYKSKKLEKNIFAIGKKDSIYYLSSMKKNILDKNDMKTYISKYDIINYTSFKNQKSRFASITNYVKLANLDFFVFGITWNQKEVRMNLDIHQKGDWNISNKYSFTPEFINNFQKNTTYLLLEVWPIFHLFNIDYKNFKQGLELAMSETNPNSGIILSEQDTKSLYSIFEKNIILSINEADNIFGIWAQLLFGDDNTWKTLKKITPFIKQYVSLLKDNDGKTINIKETENKLLFSYDKYNLELTNENNKVIGRILDPIVEKWTDKSIYNVHTLASFYYNEKKMVEVFQKFAKMYGKDIEIPSISSMINWLENKEQVYGNLYVEGSVIKLEFIIK